MSISLFISKDENPVFTCPHCSKYYSHTWKFVYGPLSELPKFTFSDSKQEDNTESENDFESDLEGIVRSNCNNCYKSTFWLKSHNPFSQELQMYPYNFNNYPPPHKDMPEHIQKTYKEAGSVMHLSLGSSAALARLTLESLLAHLGYTKGRLYDRINELENTKDISTTLKQKLYIVRKIGNTGTHVGSISFEEKPDVPKHLMTIINDIVDELITKPKTLEELQSFIND